MFYRPWPDQPNEPNRTSGRIRTHLTLRITIRINILKTFFTFWEMCWMLDILIHAGGVLVWTDEWQMHIDAYGSIRMHPEAPRCSAQPCSRAQPDSRAHHDFYCHFCLVCWGFVYYALSMVLFSMLGLCLLLFFCPNYIPTQSIPLLPPPLPGHTAVAAAVAQGGAGAPPRPRGQPIKTLWTSYQNLITNIDFEKNPFSIRYLCLYFCYLWYVGLDSQRFEVMVFRF